MTDYFVISSTGQAIYAGDIVLLAEYPDTKWITRYGYYSYMGTTKSGWYFNSIPDNDTQPLSAVNSNTITLVASSNHPNRPNNHPHKPYPPCPPKPPCPCHPGDDIPPEKGDLINRSFVTVDFIAQRDLLDDGSLPDGKIVRVNSDEKGNVHYYEYNLATRSWRDLNLGENIISDLSSINPEAIITTEKEPEEDDDSTIMTTGAILKAVDDAIAKWIEIDDNNVEKNFESTEAETSAFIVSENNQVTLSDVQINKTGDGSDENSVLTGSNAAAVVETKGTLSLEESLVQSNAKFAPSVFINPEGILKLEDCSVSTFDDSSPAIVSNSEGKINLVNTNISTKEEFSPIIKALSNTNVKIEGSTLTTTDTDSAILEGLIDATVTDSRLRANKSEAVAIQNKHKVELIDSSIVANSVSADSETDQSIRLFSLDNKHNTRRDADQLLATNDSAEFTMKNGSIQTINGFAFAVSNTCGIISLNSVDLSFGKVISDSKDYSEYNLLQVLNNADANFAGINQKLQGTIEADSSSTLLLILTNSSFKGSINSNNQSKKVWIRLDKDSTITLTADSYVSKIELTYKSQINLNGYKLYVNDKLFNPIEIDSALSLETAIKNLKTSKDSYLKLAQDLEYNDNPSYEIPKDCTLELDLNGHSITALSQVFIAKGNLILEDSTSGGIIYGTSGSANAMITVDKGTLSLKNVTIDAVSKMKTKMPFTYDVMVSNDGVVNIYEGTVLKCGYSACLSTNNTTGKGTYNIYEGKLLSTGAYGIYAPSDDTINIYGGEIEGINMRLGTLSISGNAKILPTHITEDSRDPIGVEFKTSGIIWLGDTIAVLSGCYSSNDSTDVHINIKDNATVKSDFRSAIGIYTLNQNYDANVIINIENMNNVTTSDKSSENIVVYDTTYIKEDAEKHNKVYESKTDTNVFVNDNIY